MSFSFILFALFFSYAYGARMPLRSVRHERHNLANPTNLHRRMTMGVAVTNMADTFYSGNVTLGGNNYTVQLDTGRWVAQSLHLALG
jgi:hypothetical protein